MSKETLPHVVQIVPKLRYGGAERLVVALANELVRRGYRSTVITFFPDAPLATALDRSVRHLVVPKRGKISFGLTGRLRQTLRLIETDIVHTHLFSSDAWGRRAGHTLGLPVVTTEHSTNENEGWTWQWIRRIFSSRADRYIAVSPLVSAYLKEVCHVRRPIVIVPPPIAWDQFEKVSPAFTGDTVRISMIGRLVPEKGFDEGLRALAQLPKGEWSCRIVGDGPLREHLIGLAHELGIAKEVSFSPPTSAIEEVYGSSDVVLVPSRYEGFGMVALEGLASGRLVIASRVGGLPDVISHGDNGFLFQPGDVEELFTLLDSVLRDRAEAIAVALRARASVESYDVAHMVDRYEEIYHSLS